MGNSSVLWFSFRLYPQFPGDGLRRWPLPITLILNFGTGSLAGDGGVFVWDGREQDGRRAPQGVYHVPFRHGAEVATRKIVNVR